MIIDMPNNVVVYQCEYDLVRDVNIAENNAILKSLNLHVDLPW